MTATPATALPFRVTLPETGAVAYGPLLQAAAAGARAATSGRRRGVMGAWGKSEVAGTGAKANGAALEVGREHLPAGDRRQGGHHGVHVDVGGDPAHRPVTQDKVDDAVVER